MDNNDDAMAMNPFSYRLHCYYTITIVVLGHTPVITGQDELNLT